MLSIDHLIVFSCGSLVVVRSPFLFSFKCSMLCPLIFLFTMKVIGKWIDILNGHFNFNQISTAHEWTILKQCCCCCCFCFFRLQFSFRCHIIESFFRSVCCCATMLTPRAVEHFFFVTIFFFVFCILARPKTKLATANKSTCWWF